MSKSNDTERMTERLMKYVSDELQRSRDGVETFAKDIAADPSAVRWGAENAIEHAARYAVFNAVTVRIEKFRAANVEDLLESITDFISERLLEAAGQMDSQSTSHVANASQRTTTATWAALARRFT